MVTFQNKIVLVTGAARGIGKGIAMAYAKEKAIVLVADIDFDEANKTVTEIKSEGGEALAFMVDVSSVTDIETLFYSIKAQFGQLDILINNAGISKWASPYDLEVQEWDNIINTNLRSVFLCSREAAKLMRNNGGGAIVNIASTRALMSEPNTEAYAASKGGTVAITHALAASFAKDAIQVNCISPGWIETREYSTLSERDHSQHWSGRVGQPVDIAQACLYLTQQGNNFINGTNIVIDGGMTKKMIYDE